MINHITVIHSVEPHATSHLEIIFTTDWDGNIGDVLSLDLIQIWMLTEYTGSGTLLQTNIDVENSPFVWFSFTRRIEDKPKEYPQQRETKTVAKEDVYCPALFTLEVGRASCNHGTNTVWKKTLFQKRLRYCGQHARSSCKGFSSQRIAVRLTLHFIYLTYIIHIFFVLYITYIFYTIF